MPSRVASTTGVTNAAGKRFELPALDLDFGNITDGTTIPPPPASPVQKVPTPPQTPPADKQKEVKNANGIEKPTSVASNANGNLAGTKRPAEDAPVSPAKSGRQGSLRRLFSRTNLNNTYAEGQTSNGHAVAAAAIGRPPSQSGGSVFDDRKSKRNSGWFRRLRTGEPASRRSSFMLEQSSITSPKKAGPPPPMIPELKDLEQDEGSLGSDLFKNIR